MPASIRSHDADSLSSLWSGPRSFAFLFLPPIVFRRRPPSPISLVTHSRLSRTFLPVYGSRSRLPHRLRRICVNTTPGEDPTTRSSRYTDYRSTGSLWYGIVCRIRRKAKMCRFYQTIIRKGFPLTRSVINDYGGMIA